MAFAQMAHFYNVPCGGYIGLTNSKINDAQSGYETGMSATAAMLAGADMMNMCGLLNALTEFDFAKAVIDSEIAMMLKRIKRGMEFSEENLALDVIADIGPSGSFMTHKHTVKWMRKAALLPNIADRDPREVWKTRGGTDAHQKALQRAKDILSKENPVVFPEELDQLIREKFSGLVPGESQPL